MADATGISDVASSLGASSLGASSFGTSSLVATNPVHGATTAIHGATTTAPRGSMDASAWGLVGLFGAIFALSMRSADDPDLGWHLATGRWIAQHHRVPFADPFSWSVPGRKWIAHEWLTELLMHGIRRIAGDGGLILVWSVVITTAWVLLFKTARVIGGSRRFAAPLTALGAVSSIHTWGVRPQMLTLLLVVVFLLRLSTWRAHRSRTPWELPALTALWVNLHGGYIFGIAMVLIFALGETGELLLTRWPRLPIRQPDIARRNVGSIWGLFVGCVVMSLLSPNTIDGLIYPFTYLGDNASTRYVGEWLRPNLSNPQFWPFALLGALSAGLLIVALRRRCIGLTEIGLTVPFGLMAFQSMRNITQFAVCSVPICAYVLTQLGTRRQQHATVVPKRPGKTQVTALQKSRLAAASASTVVVCLVALQSGNLTQGSNANARAKQFPTGTTVWLQRHPGGKLFNHYNYGGWLILNEVPVFVDGRPDMYGDQFMDSYVRIAHSKNNDDWAARVANVGANRILLPTSSTLAKRIHADIESGKTVGWRQVDKDRVSTLFANDLK